MLPKTGMSMQSAFWKSLLAGYRAFAFGVEILVESRRGDSLISLPEDATVGVLVHQLRVACVEIQFPSIMCRQSVDFLSSSCWTDEGNWWTTCGALMAAGSMCEEPGRTCWFGSLPSFI